MKLKNIWKKIKLYFKELPYQPTFDDSIESLNRLAKNKQFLEEEVKVQNEVIKLQKEFIKLQEEENKIQSKLLEEYKAYAPKNQQGIEGKSYKGSLLIKKEDGTYEYI